MCVCSSFVCARTSHRRIASCIRVVLIRLAHRMETTVVVTDICHTAHRLGRSKVAWRQSSCRLCRLSLSSSSFRCRLPGENNVLLVSCTHCSLHVACHGCSGRVALRCDWIASGANTLEGLCSKMQCRRSPYISTNKTNLRQQKLCCNYAHSCTRYTYLYAKGVCVCLRVFAFVPQRIFPVI